VALVVATIRIRPANHRVGAPRRRWGADSSSRRGAGGCVALSQPGSWGEVGDLLGGREGSRRSVEGIDLQANAGSDQAVEDRRSMAAFIASGEEPILPPNRYPAQRAFLGVVVDVEDLILKIAGQCGPLAASVADGLGHGALRRHATDLLPQPEAQRLDDRLGFLWAERQTVLRLTLSPPLLDLVETANVDVGRTATEGSLRVYRWRHSYPARRLAISLRTSGTSSTGISIAV